MRRCETEPKPRYGAGDGGKSAWYGRGTQCSRATEREYNAENGSDHGNRNDGSVGALRGALAGESETAGGAVD